MQCPLDQTQLTIADRQGIEIDYCPTCRGVWLDRGELDKLIERSNSFAPGVVRPAEPQPRREEYREPSQPRRHDDDDDDEYRSNPNHDPRGKHHKKESFLGDMFDF